LRKNCPYNILTENVYRGRKDEEEDLNNYWKTLRKIEDTGNWKRKHEIAALCRELAFEGAVDLSKDKLPDE